MNRNTARNSTAWLLAGLCLFWGASGASAQTEVTFVSNLDQTDSWDLGSDSYIGRTTYRGQKFHTGDISGTYTLTEIVIETRKTLVGTASFALHHAATSGTVTVPGDKIVDLNGSVLPAGEQSFTPARPRL